MPPAMQPNLVPYSDTMASYYTSNLLGSTYPIIANFLFWIWFVNFNVGIFEALPINHLPGGKLYNSIIEDRAQKQTTMDRKRNNYLNFNCMYINSCSIILFILFNNIKGKTLYSM